jgi:hypothetical protein
MPGGVAYLVVVASGGPHLQLHLEDLSIVEQLVVGGGHRRHGRVAGDHVGAQALAAEAAARPARRAGCRRHKRPAEVDCPGLRDIDRHVSI